MSATQFLKNMRGTDDFELINFEDPILDRIIYYTLISHIPQKVAIWTNIVVCGQGHTYHPGKEPSTINFRPINGQLVAIS